MKNPNPKSKHRPQPIASESQHIRLPLWVIDIYRRWATVDMRTHHSLMVRAVTEAAEAWEASRTHLKAVEVARQDQVDAVGHDM